MKAGSGTTVRVKYMHIIFSRIAPKIGTTDVENFMCPRIQNCVKYMTLLYIKAYRLYIINSEQHATEFIYLMTDMHLDAKHTLCCSKVVYRILCKIWWDRNTCLSINPYIPSASHSQLYKLTGIFVISCLSQLNVFIGHHWSIRSHLCTYFRRTKMKWPFFKHTTPAWNKPIL